MRAYSDTQSSRCIFTKEELDEKEKKDVAMQGVERLRSFFKYTLRLPVTLPELGIPEPDIDTLVRKLHENKGQAFGNYYTITPEVSREIYRMAME